MSARAVDIGLPVSRDSSCDSSSWCASTDSPRRSSRRPRSSAVMRPQSPSSAARAACTAAFTSACWPRGMVVNTLPSTGDTTSMVRPSAASA
ncbi:hypothetical protein G6F32_016904 [Rhizopus arrhizus]|nr:hypothetical protein G6F32_016904 [Rhizopus arrhizus]